jgi:hypothetical protein
LPLKNNRIRVPYRSVINRASIAHLLEEAGISGGIVWIDFGDGHAVRWGGYGAGTSSWSGMYAANRGTGWVMVEHWNWDTGEVRFARVHVEVYYTFGQWMLMIFLGGWIWLPYTTPGPLNIWRELYALSSWGLGNAIRDLLYDWFGGNWLLR